MKMIVWRAPAFLAPLLQKLFGKRKPKKKKE
jgi:hypothetical protein